MSRPESISNAEARKLILQAQGLTVNSPFGKGRMAVSRAIHHLGYVQLDTISVVERAHHHILWSRIPGYLPQWLTEVQVKHRDAFEYWAHAAAYLPMEFYRFSFPVMQDFQRQRDRWPKSSEREMKSVLNRIRHEGPLLSRNFDSDHKGGAWWDWKPAKWALQRLFFEGRLMVSHREGFQRVYDLPERVLPEGLDLTPPTNEEYYRHHILTTLEAQGLAEKRDLVHLRKIDHALFEKILHQLVEESLIISVRSESGRTYYLKSSLPTSSARYRSKVRIISPFDNLVIWRNRLRDLFDFDYTLECYFPVHTRVYGYFALPILYRDTFIGRMDCKADRKSGVLQVHNVNWEPGWSGMANDALFTESLASFATFNQCEEYSMPSRRHRKK